MLGELYETRRLIYEAPNSPFIHQHPSIARVTNQLINGMLIDVGGIFFIFQDPIAMARASQDEIDSTTVMNSLREMRPICPVLFNEIQFQYQSPMECYLQILRQNDETDAFPVYSKVGPIHVPFVNNDEVPEDVRAYVFPACGHVSGFHKSLEEKGMCPLCRQVGPFVPLSFVFENSLFSGSPTHVFNPCGHTGSESLCLYWSQLQIFHRILPRSTTTTIHSSTANENSHNHDEIYSAICPFCATELNHQRPFSKLIFQADHPDLSQGSSEDLKQERWEHHQWTSSPWSANWENPTFQEELFKSQRFIYEEKIKRELSPPLFFPVYIIPNKDSVTPCLK